ncbi:hypothetical protein MPH_08591 [Macrophomina phaseolina MS6]|uniref:Uncharacterized protein n=1 Tax=Macrophomina phaseolina (strain MS6) TaxID=1126212 RepID=K2QWL4_MACPH|nr:hypothetical protein MPH_08591 [Macrophomina phaseolina MS6]
MAPQAFQNRDLEQYRDPPHEGERTNCKYAYDKCTTFQDPQQATSISARSGCVRHRRGSKGLDRQTCPTSSLLHSLSVEMISRARGPTGKILGSFRGRVAGQCHHRFLNKLPHTEASQHGNKRRQQITNVARSNARPVRVAVALHV